MGIRVTAQANALGMLRSKPAYRIGEAQGAEFFIVDGKAWMIQRATAYRFEDSRDMDRIKSAFHTLSAYTQ